MSTAIATGDDRKFGLTTMTIDTLRFFAGAFAVIAVVAAASYSLVVGDAATVTTLCLVVTATILCATVYVSYNPTVTHKAARRVRNAMTLGLTLGAVGLISATALVAMQLVFLYFVSQLPF